MSALTALEIRELTNFLKPFLEREYLDRVYPIGSLYFSATEVDPSALFGGTWERIKDRFLLSAGDTYTAGSMGGEATHTLTVEEMPSHSHATVTHAASTAQDGWGMLALWGDRGGSQDYYLLGSDKTTEIYTTNSKGGGKPHNNMPPYLAVCVWKRIA